MAFRGPEVKFYLSIYFFFAAVKLSRWKWELQLPMRSSSRVKVATENQVTKLWMSFKSDLWENVGFPVSRKELKKVTNGQKKPNTQIAGLELIHTYGTYY